MVTERGVCWSTSTNPTTSNSKKVVGSGIGTFTADLSGLNVNDEVTYYVRAYAINSKGTAYGEQITITTKKIKGAIMAGFSVSATKQVYFSQGNLQYQASTGTWRFAGHQYDIIGDGNKNISSSYSGWIDLFGWGTSGWKSGAIAYQPYSNSTKNIDYAIYSSGSYLRNDLTGSYANADWGVYNKISNGGNQAGQWRTLTFDEWEYLMNTRANASTKQGVACVNGVNGLILLPDEWTLPDGIVFTSGVANDYGSEYYATVNNYSENEWSKMETNGAVFLPAAGGRDQQGVGAFGYNGYYWSSSANGSFNAFCLCFISDYVIAENYHSRSNGLSVRLVR